MSGIKRVVIDGKEYYIAVLVGRAPAAARPATMLCPHDFGDIGVGACKLGCGAFRYLGGKIAGEPPSAPKANPYTQVDTDPKRSPIADAVHNAVRATRSRG